MIIIEKEEKGEKPLHSQVGLNTIATTIRSIVGSRLEKQLPKVQKGANSSKKARWTIKVTFPCSTGIDEFRTLVKVILWALSSFTTVLADLVDPVHGYPLVFSGQRVQRGDHLSERVIEVLVHDH